MIPSARLYSRIALAGVAASLLFAAAAAWSDEIPDSPPILLRKGLLLTPIETAGTGVAPEVEVRVTVDRRGRVEAVEVLSITPPTEHDEVFRRATVKTIEAWRYAPALLDGEPVEATLEWTIQFQEKPGQGEGNHPTVGTGLALGPILDEASRRARIFTLSREQQAERLLQNAGLAEPYLDLENRRRAETPRFVVVSDSPEAGTAETVAQNLEAVFHLLDRTFGPGMGLQPTPYKQVVYVYWNHASFASLVGELGAPEWANGLYVPPGLFAFHLETGDVEYLLSALIHEAVHAYADQHLVHPGFHLPPWLNEGLAEYVSNSEVRKGKLTLGSIRESRAVLDFRRGGAYRRTTHVGWSLEEARRAVRSGKAASPESLLAMDDAAFYGDEWSMHYAVSWLLVHYLRHGEPGWSEEAFPDLLLYVAEGYPTEAALEAVYGVSPADLAEPLREYVGEL